MCHGRMTKPKSRLAQCLTPYPHAWVPCHMLLLSPDNHGGNLAHGTLGHVMTARVMEVCTFNVSDQVT